MTNIIIWRALTDGKGSGRLEEYHFWRLKAKSWAGFVRSDSTTGNFRSRTVESTYAPVI